MCYRLDELYSACHCLYYRQALDRCPHYGTPGHTITVRTIYVGYTCAVHADTYDYPSPTQRNDIHGGTLKPNEEDSDDNASVSSFSSQIFSSSSLPSTSVTSNVDSLITTLLQDLLHHNYLRYLWPQLVALSSSPERAKRTIRRFIEHYGDDLRAQAEEAGLREKEIATFVGKVAPKIASRLLRATHYAQLGKEAQIHRDEGDSTDEEDSKDLSFDYRLEFEFLFETGAIECLQTNVWAFVQSAALNPSPAYIFMANFSSSFVNLFNRTKRWLDGKDSSSVRLDWTCGCGITISDDYKEIESGSINKIRIMLSQYHKLDFHTAAAPSCISQRNSDQPGIHNGRGIVKLFGDWAWVPWSALQTRISKPSLPCFNSPGPQPDSTNPFECSSSQPGENHNFLLLCTPFMAFGTRLCQPDVCRLRSDRDLFLLLRDQYRSSLQHENWWQRYWHRLRRVRSIEFTQFEYFPKQSIVDITNAPSLPPADLLAEGLAEYQYEPKPPKVIPPVGPNLLAHFLHHPDHAEVVPIIMSRLPVKLRRRLNGPCVGWGLRFVEGVDPSKIFVVVTTGFLFCLILAIFWAVGTKDVQSGFAIGSFILAFLGFCVGLGTSSSS